MPTSQRPTPAPHGDDRLALEVAILASELSAPQAPGQEPHPAREPDATPAPEPPDDPAPRPRD